MTRARCLSLLSAALSAWALSATGACGDEATGTPSSSSGDGGAGAAGGGAGGTAGSAPEGGGGTSTLATSSTGGSGGAGGAGSTGGGGATGGSGSGGAACTAFPQPCAECAFEYCQADYCVCFGDSACVGLTVCLLGCSDTDCANACYTSNEDGIAKALIVVSCAATPCEDVCDGAFELSPCELCAAKKCEDQFNPCLANPECNAIISCIRNDCASGDPTCQANCLQDHPGGAAQAGNLVTCMQGGCAAECERF